MDRPSVLFLLFLYLLNQNDYIAWLHCWHFMIDICGFVSQCETSLDASVFKLLHSRVKVYSAPSSLSRRCSLCIPNHFYCLALLLIFYNTWSLSISLSVSLSFGIAPSMWALVLPAYPWWSVRDLWYAPRSRCDNWPNQVSLCLCFDNNKCLFLSPTFCRSGYPLSAVFPM